MKTKIQKIEISSLPEHPSKFQRQYIDDYFNGSLKEILGKKIISATYGHCQDYPYGFYLTIEN